MEKKVATSVNVNVSAEGGNVCIWINGEFQDTESEPSDLKARCYAEPMLPEGYRLEWRRDGRSDGLYVTHDKWKFWCCRIERCDSIDYIRTYADYLRRGDSIDVFIEIIPAALAEYRKRYPQVELVSWTR